MSDIICSCRTHSGGHKEKHKWLCLFCGLWKKNKSKYQRTLLYSLSFDDGDVSNITRSLFQSIQEGRSEDVKEIIDYNPSLREDGSLETVMLVSLHRGMFCVVDWLVETGLDSKTTDSVFLVASKRGDARIMEKLLDAGASVNVSNRYGCTALHMAAERSDPDTLSMLLKRGADGSVKDRDGSTPLHYAVRVCSVDAILVLAKSGADLNAVNNHGCSLLHEALKRQIAFVDGEDIKIVRYPKKDYLEMIGFLLKNIPDISNTIGRLDKSGNSCFHYAVQNLNHDNIEAINLLVDAGSSINCSNADGMTPLFISVQKENAAVIRALLERGADVEAKALDGSTALHAAVVKYYHQLVNLLLEFGADVDAVTCDGVTPFQIALYWPARYNLFTVLDSVVSLVQHGANIFFSVGYRPNPFVNKDFANLVTQPLNCMIPILIYAIRCDTTYLQSNDTDSIFDRWSKLFCKLCVDELSKMKEDRIGNQNFYELLTCNNNLFLKYIRNKEVSNVFTSKYHLSKFNVYGSILEAKFKKASKRLKLLKSGIYFFDEIFQNKENPVLPQECVDHILDYLKDSHLKKIQTVFLGQRFVTKDRDSDTDLNEEYITYKWLSIHENCLEILAKDNS